MRPEIPEDLAQRVREEAEEEIGVDTDDMGFHHCVRALVEYHEWRS